MASYIRGFFGGLIGGLRGAAYGAKVGGEAGWDDTTGMSSRDLNADRPGRRVPPLVKTVGWGVAGVAAAKLGLDPTHLPLMHELFVASPTFHSAGVVDAQSFAAGVAARGALKVGGKATTGAVTWGVRGAREGAESARNTEHYSRLGSFVHRHRAGAQAFAPLDMEGAHRIVHGGGDLTLLASKGRKVLVEGAPIDRLNIYGDDEGMEARIQTPVKNAELRGNIRAEFAPSEATEPMDLSLMKGAQASVRARLGKVYVEGRSVLDVKDTGDGGGIGNLTAMGPNTVVNVEGRSPRTYVLANGSRVQNTSSPGYEWKLEAPSHGAIEG